MATPPSRATASRAAGDGPRLPRWLLVLGVPLVGVALVVLFVFIQFPFERFGDVLAGQTGDALGADVTIGSLEPALTVGGPGFVVRDVAVRWPSGESAAVAAARLRPSWSLSWLSGSPAFRLDADSDVGSIAGAITVGAAPRFDGRLAGVDLDRLPVERFTQGTSLAGALDLEADLRFRDGSPVGDTRFVAREGSLSAGQLPIALPYTELRGRIDFGDDGSLTLEDVALEGPMLSAQLSGGTQAGPSLWLAPLDVRIQLEVSDRNLVPTFRSAGLRLGPDGRADLRVTGTLSAPVVR